MARSWIDSRIFVSLPAAVHKNLNLILLSNQDYYDAHVFHDQKHDLRHSGSHLDPHRCHWNAKAPRRPAFKPSIAPGWLSVTAHAIPEPKALTPATRFAISTINRPWKHRKCSCATLAHVGHASAACNACERCCHPHTSTASASGRARRIATSCLQSSVNHGASAHSTPQGSPAACPT